jgi:hypothetical protein
METKNTEELKVLFPDRVFHSKHGDAIISTFKFMEFEILFEFIDRYKLVFKDVKNEKSFVLQLLAQGSQVLNDIIFLVELSTDKNKDWLDRFELNELVDLLLKIVEVNSTFFIQQINQVSLVLAEKIRAVGQTSSPSSSPTDTDGLTSEVTR